MALEQAINDAKNIDFQCKQTLVCPKSPSGWQINGTRISKHVVGAWLKYPLSYHSDTRKFTIRVYQGPDIGTIILVAQTPRFQLCHIKNDDFSYLLSH